jgi:short subunit dehydrogenase-like uncharacterized protein
MERVSSTVLLQLSRQKKSNNEKGVYILGCCSFAVIPTQKYN